MLAWTVPFRDQELARHMFRSISRRSGLGLSLGALVMPGSARAAAPFETPAEILRAFIRLRGALDERVVYWWLDDVRSAIVGTKVYPLFRARVGTFLKVRQLEPDAYAVTFLETSYYVDLKTDQLLTGLKNPVTGAEMEISSVVLGPSTSIMRASGEEAPRRARGGTVTSRSTHGPVTVVGDDVLITEDRFSRIDFPDPATPPYNTSELNVYRGLLTELEDPTAPYVRAWVSYQSVSAFQPRHKMDGVDGHISARAVGAKVPSLEAMPAAWRVIADRQNPDILVDIARALAKAGD